jgi:hypothetical protein
MSAERFRYSVYRIAGETIRLSHRHMRREVGIFVSNSIWLRGHDDGFSTNYQQKLWKIQKTCHALTLFFFFLSSLGLSACSQGKGVERFKTLPAGTTLIASSETEVRKILGEPDVVSKTIENRILWTYNPSWKIVPSPKDTLYVEFDGERVVKIFQVK